MQLAGADNPVYGDTFAQHFVSTFHVVLCERAVGIFVVALITGRLSGRFLRRRPLAGANGRNRLRTMPRVARLQSLTETRLVRGGAS
jgi:hypothetical protein